jgi:hypothetical protein
MSTYVIRVHRARPGGRTLLRIKNPREVALHVAVANKCTLTHFQPATASYPMTLVCDAKDNLAIAAVLRSLDVFGYVQTEIAQIA